jgi:hypothetical protein
VIVNYYLVNSGYPNRTSYVAPFKRSTYLCLRLQSATQGKYEIFNYFHSSIHNVIECLFRALKQKMMHIEVDAEFLILYTTTYHYCLHDFTYFFERQGVYKSVTKMKTYEA